jgi:hypothetical protein
MGNRTLDCNQSGRAVHAERKIKVGGQGLGMTDYRMVIPSSVIFFRPKFIRVKGESRDKLWVQSLSVDHI